MSRGLRLSLLLTDGLFLIYWALTSLEALRLISIPPLWLYSNYADPRVVAWNWSFFPLDLAFSLVGFAAVAAERRGSHIWQPLTLISLLLTSVAGTMAVAYWTMTGEIDASWYGINFALAIWPLFYIPRFVCGWTGAAKA
jgi:hypothetical protein